MAALMEFTSHIAGKNAKVSVYPDRIEWTRGRLSMKKLTAGAVTAGFSLMKTGARDLDVEAIPVRAITGVSSKKGMVHSTVTVSSASGALEMRCSHDEADRVKSTLLGLMA